ncbi:unnamed protein product [Paramecium sonneborni]|uniref:WD40-repeat-containing domain n=1 Tax=Paramecium sonneborni TaxID=65129 RepID=A0A8S1LCK3_9CILI|nr:unnamed protein product [Paramecium sonneborni]
MYKPKMIENEKDLVCQMNHKQSISMIVLDSNLSSNQRLLCQQCIDVFKTDAQIIEFKKVIQIIEDNKIKSLDILENLIKQNIQYIELFQTQVFNLKSHLVQQLDHLINNTKDWVLNLQSTGSKYSQYSFYQELDLIIMNQQSTQNDQINLNDQIKIINDAWKTEVNYQLEIFKSFKEYQQSKDILKNLTNQSQQEQIKSNIIINQIINQDKEQKKQITDNVIIQQQQLSPYKLQFIDDSIQQEEWCNAIVFDPTGKIMVSINGEDIIIWNINNRKINHAHLLQGHSQNVSCLIYSLINNYFISGSFDNSIRIWKYQNNNQWQSSKPYNEHKHCISCIILTSKEDQLISCSFDRSIKVWIIDLNNNELKLLYSLEKHTDYVFSLSLNQTERVLVSCGVDGQIIIWKKQLNSQWQFQIKFYISNYQTYFFFKFFMQIILINCNYYNKTIKEYGFHVKFLQENQFIWVPYSSHNLCVFECKDEDQYQENIEKRIQFQKDNQRGVNYLLFPIIYNKDKNLICLRRAQHIFIIKVQINGFLSIVEQLDCQDCYIYGSLTNNGQYLVYWGEKTKKYKTYEILYK